MSRLSDKLEKMFSKELDYPCTIYYCKGSPYGWMFKTDQTHPQRIGYTFTQAVIFIKGGNWTWLKNHLAEHKRKE